MDILREFLETSTIHGLAYISTSKVSPSFRIWLIRDAPNTNLAVFNRPESDHCLPLSQTHSLTNCCLVNLIDVSLACEDANSKLVEVVTVAGVDDEDRDSNSLLQTWKLRFDHKT